MSKLSAIPVRGTWVRYKIVYEEGKVSVEWSPDTGLWNQDKHMRPSS